ncbi:MAG: large subunit ribosomal protein [Fimbriimonadaceae bacterium]|jgi:large subunit ribosomal protein L4|nr:large subunit ribosomal protein [Fimbriimonadaceae bacterium]
MASIEVKSKEGKKVGSYDLSEALSGATVSPVTLHRTVVAEEANTRQGTQKAKTRSETRGGGRKPYKQKKTGRARQGSIRSPQYAHGGMALAVAPRDYEKKVNRKERRASILAALASRVEAGDVIVADAIVFAEPKTREALAMLTALGVNDIRRVLVVLPQHDAMTYKSFRNLPNVTVRTAPARNGEETKAAAFSTRDLLVAHKIVIAQDALKKIEEVWGQ